MKGKYKVRNTNSSKEHVKSYKNKKIGGGSSNNFYGFSWNL